MILDILAIFAASVYSGLTYGQQFRLKFALEIKILGIAFLNRLHLSLLLPQLSCRRSSRTLFLCITVPDVLQKWPQDLRVTTLNLIKKMLISCKLVAHLSCSNPELLVMANLVHILGGTKQPNSLQQRYCIIKRYVIYS